MCGSMDNNKLLASEMTDSRRLVVKIFFVCLLLISLFLFLYTSNVIPFFKANWDPQKNEPEVFLMEIPGEEDLEELSHKEVAELYHRYINTVQVLCRRIVRIGQLGDGGWEVCEDKEYKPKPPCTVFSFGIGDDFSFDDHMAQRYGCTVHSFDPSINVPEGERGKGSWFHTVGLSSRNQELANGWTMETFDEITKKLKFEQKTLDIVKVDIEESEWQVIPQMAQSGSLHHIRQLIIELHIAIGPEPMREKYIRGLLVLKSLFDQGFRIYFTHRNLWCHFLSKFEGIDEVGCHEVSFIRMNS